MGDELKSAMFFSVGFWAINYLSKRPIIFLKDLLKQFHESWIYWDEMVHYPKKKVSKEHIIGDK